MTRVALLTLAAALAAPLAITAAPASAADAPASSSPARPSYDTDPSPSTSAGSDRLIPAPPGSSVDSRRDRSERAIDGRPLRDTAPSRAGSAGTSTPAMTPYTGRPPQPIERLGR